MIKAICDGVAYQCCLNSIDRVSTFWRVLEQFSDNLRCCPNMFASTEARLPCTRCSNNRTRSLSAVHEYHRTTVQSPIRKSYAGHTSSYSSGSHHHHQTQRNSGTEHYERQEHVRSEHLSSAGYNNMPTFDFGAASVSSSTTIRHDSECDSPNTASRKDSVFEAPLSTPTAGEKSLTPSSKDSNIAVKRDLKRDASSLPLSYQHHRERGDYREVEADNEQPKSKKKKVFKMQGISYRLSHGLQALIFFSFSLLFYRISYNRVIYILFAKCTTIHRFPLSTQRCFDVCNVKKTLAQPPNNVFLC